ncbi:MAG TPA: hypothetical protein VL400_24270 [Polyangiaceae bacterium]|nr:hypothetical protein [Polyangiaceae bacterium]
MTEPERPSRPSPTDEVPETRAPVIPEEPSKEALSQAPRRASKPGPQGTVRMSASDIPANRKTASGTIITGPSGRSTATSLGPARKSRLDTIRHTLMSVLPPIPKSFSGAPILALSGVGFVLLIAFVFLAATNRLPASIKSFSWGKTAPTEEAFIPPPVPADAEIVDDLVGPSAEPGRANVGRGVLSIPKTFTAMKDGGFDFVIHFNGNTELAVESYEVSLLDAVVMVVNLGNGSGVYEDFYQNPDNLERVLQRVPEIMKKRGLENAHIKRLALVGWSAGYGAIVKILEHKQHADLVDAVILLDGLHTSYKPGTTIPEASNIQGVIDFAERAKTGEKLLVITHSNIQPIGYLGVHETVDFLLTQVNVERHEAHAQTTLPNLVAAKGVLPKDELRALELKTEARQGSLIVRGFGGDQAAHHISHLLQMSEIALPELAKRWAPPPSPEASATVDVTVASAAPSAAASASAAPVASASAQGSASAP